MLRLLFVSVAFLLTVRGYSEDYYNSPESSSEEETATKEDFIVLLCSIISFARNICDSSSSSDDMSLGSDSLEDYLEICQGFSDEEFLPFKFCDDQDIPHSVESGEENLEELMQKLKSTTALKSLDEIIQRLTENGVKPTERRLKSINSGKSIKKLLNKSNSEIQPLFFKIIKDHFMNSSIVQKIINKFKNVKKIFLPSYNRKLIWGNDNKSVPFKLASKDHLGRLRKHDSNRIPEFFDWRDEHAVSPVKDQQRCQACWAFSVVANIESMLKIYLNKEFVLSEQFLIDCVPDSGGCSGKASLLSVFGYIVTKLGGVLKSDSYDAYSAKQGKCKYNGPPPYPVPVVGMHRVPQDEDAMAEYLYKYGPLSAAINSKSMDNYNAVYIDEPTNEQCPQDHLDHTVLIVGYNYHEDKQTGKRVPYWIIKNSWGPNWGDHGFYYLVRGRNACGIASDVSFASVA